MSKEAARTRPRERPLAPLLPKDFVGRAPTDRGPDALMDWLDNGHLHEAVRQEVNARLDYLPPLQHLGPVLRDHVEHALAYQTRIATQLLWCYADVRHEMITYHDPQKVYWRDGARAKMPPALCKKLVKPGRVERLKERQLAFEQLISALGLDAERAVIDYLFEETAAIPGPVSRDPASRSGAGQPVPVKSGRPSR